MTVIGTFYSHQAAPWDAPLSLGVQSLIEYNGYVINDRYQADRVRVTNITGLDEPDLSDSRETLPGDDGEVVYDSYYRGRTIVMSGRIEAGSLSVLKRLERDLKAAYAPLAESPLKFRWFDVHDSFDDPKALQNYTLASGTVSAATIAGGALRYASSTPLLALRTADRRGWGDKQVTMRIIPAATAPTTRLICAYKDASNYSFVQLAGTALSTSVVVAGQSYTLSTVPVPATTQGAPMWLRGRTEGDRVTAELWLSRPVETKLPDYSTATTLQGSDADTLGDGVLSSVGFYLIASPSAPVAVGDFMIRSLSPGDVVIWARKMPNGMSIKDSQDSPTMFNRVFQITLRASQPFAMAATQSRSSQFTPSALYQPTLGFQLPMTFPLTFRRYISGLSAPANTFTTVKNLGTAPTRPVIRIDGAVSNLTIANLTNGQQIDWSGVLTDGDRLTFDCARRTLVDSSGTSRMANFRSNSRAWLQLEPGPNDIFFAGSGYSGSAQMVVFFRSAWI